MCPFETQALPTLTLACCKRMLELLPASAASRQAASQVMVAAFNKYPLFCYMVPEGTRYSSFLRWLFPRMLAIFQKGGLQVYSIKEVAEGSLVGIVICAPPASKRGALEQTTLQNMQHGLLKVPFLFGLGTLNRLLKVTRLPFLSLLFHFFLLEPAISLHPQRNLADLQVLDTRQVDGSLTASKHALGKVLGPFWYIEFLCVDPGVQSRGLGSAGLRELVKQVLQRDPGATIILSTADPKNRGFYKKNGFVELCQKPVCGVPNWWYVYRREML